MPLNARLSELLAACDNRQLELIWTLDLQKRSTSYAFSRSDLSSRRNLIGEEIESLTRNLTGAKYSNKNSTLWRDILAMSILPIYDRVDNMYEKFIDVIAFDSIDYVEAENVVLDIWNEYLVQRWSEYVMRESKKNTNIKDNIKYRAEWENGIIRSVSSCDRYIIRRYQPVPFVDKIRQKIMSSMEPKNAAVTMLAMDSIPHILSIYYNPFRKYGIPLNPLFQPENGPIHSKSFGKIAAFINRLLHAVHGRVS